MVCRIWFIISLFILYFQNIFAIFDDEAYRIDWQLENIGTYDCVVNGPEKSLVILSSFENVSMLSWVNKTSGSVLSRQILDFKANDMMSLHHETTLAVKREDGCIKLYDAKYGIQIEDIPPVQFVSCQVDLKKYDYIIKRINETDKRKILYQTKDQVNDVIYLDVESLNAYSILFKSEDDKYYFSTYDDGNLTNKWQRDESLNDIVTYTYISTISNEFSLTSNELSGKTLNIFDAYLSRLKFNMNRLKRYLLAKKFSIGKIILDIFRDESEESIKNRNFKFGLLKGLIIATKKGRVALLDINSGNLLWSIETGYSDIKSLHTLKNDTELAVFDSSGKYILLDLPTSHQPSIKSEHLIQSFEKLSPLENTGVFYLKNYSNYSLAFLENNITYNEAFIVDHDEYSIYSYMIHDGLLINTWRIDVHPYEKIIAFVGREDVSTINIGNILGNRTVLYKYLNPNLAGYIIANEKTNHLIFNIIDTVTGDILYFALHDDMPNFDMPVNIVFGEYWCIYTYFSHYPLPEQRIVVVEMYESLTPNARIHNSKTQDSLFNSERPRFISKSYLFPEIIKNMILTKTKFGISAKGIVMELETGQITFLPKYILNARRVAESEMTEDDKKEFMMIPYVGSIPNDDHFIITHYRNLILGPNSSLVSIPTNLESTAIICAVGHDVFCSKVSPSSQFDKLNPSFENGKLIAIILGLFFMCYFLKPIVNNRRVRHQWLVKDEDFSE